MKYFIFYFIKRNSNLNNHNKKIMFLHQRYYAYFSYWIINYSNNMIFSLIFNEKINFVLKSLRKIISSYIYNDNDDLNSTFNQ